MTQADERAPVWLTQAKYDALREELEELRGPGRAAVVQKVSDARDEGDLKENGGYHAAKEEQGKMEARIRQLTQLLETAVIGEKPADDGVVEPGMVVTVDMSGDEETFLLGSREITDDSMHVFSEKSPIGAAVNGAKVGDTVTYAAPSGKQVEVKVLATKPYES